MANNQTTTHFVRGRLDWARVLGTPKMNDYSGVREWSVDITPDANSRKTLPPAAKAKLRDPKEKDFRKESFISFRHKETRTDAKSGEVIKQEPISVKDAAGVDWPENKLLGNGTIADIKYTVRDYGVGKPKGVYIRAIRVLKHEPFEVQEFAPMSEDDEYFASSEETSAAPETESTATNNQDDLDDDVPF